MSGTPALPNVGGPWVSHRQSFRIEVPCNISCNISRRIGVSAGQSRLLTARCHGLEKTKPQVRSLLTCGYRGGQGRGRTADLPIFRPKVPVPEGRLGSNPCSAEGSSVPYRSAIQELVLANPLANWGDQGRPYPPKE